MSRENDQIAPYLESWYGRENGRYLIASLRRSLQPILDLSFGYHILQMGAAPSCELFGDSPINHQIYTADQPGGGVNLISNADELPLECDSIDTLIAHHSLEFGPNPHRVLREIQRVLAPQGQLLIVGFNPYSLLGVGAYLRGKTRNPLWRAQHPVGRRRLTDWLHLLGCEVQSCNYLYCVPPVGSGTFRSYLSKADAWSSQHKLPIGGLYVLHAVKQVSALNKPRMRLRERGGRLIGLTVPKPAVAPSATPSAVRPAHVTKNSGDFAA